MAYIQKKDTDGTKAILLKGELGYDDYDAGGDAGRVYVGNGTTNIALATKDELDGLSIDSIDNTTATGVVITATTSGASASMLTSTNTGAVTLSVTAASGGTAIQAYGVDIGLEVTSNASTGKAISASGQIYANQYTAVDAVYGHNGGTGNGVYGYAISANGVKGYSVTGYGVYGDTAAGTYGLYTPDKTWSSLGVSPFTGSHIAYSQIEHEIGTIVESEDAWGINIYQTLVKVNIASEASKKVFGVVSSVKDDINETIVNSGFIGSIDDDGNFVVDEEFKPYYDELISGSYKEIEVNALGEGMIKVTNTHGNIDNGDYIISNGYGLGVKQNDDILRSSTVAKALESVDWSTETSTTKMIACTYHCG